MTSDTIARDEDNPLEIGNDVWVGAHAILLPNCRKIADGAVIGAGAVVTHDVPEFAIVVGNPAKVIGWRYPVELQALVKKTKWWDYDIVELLPHLHLFTDIVIEERIKMLFSEQESSL